MVRLRRSHRSSRSSIRSNLTTDSLPWGSLHRRLASRSRSLPLNQLAATHSIRFRDHPLVVNLRRLGVFQVLLSSPRLVMTTLTVPLLLNRSLLLDLSLASTARLLRLR